MSQDIIVAIPITHFFLPLISIVLLTFAIIVGLDCTWRVEKRLKTFMKLLLLGIIIKTFQEIFSLLAPAEALAVSLNIISSFFLLLALIEMYKIVRSWDGEQ